MPEVRMQIEWPGQEADQVYSPSSVIRDYFEEGESMPVADFEARVVEALEAAGDRVREVYGTRCASARAETERLRDRIQHVAEGEHVTIVRL
jgi:uncharacterized repeat protein (TIGR04042 family)